jgi:AraC-like DNA-binding protein
LEIERGEAHFIVEERADFGSARDVLVLALLTSLVNIGRTLVGGTFSGRIEFAFPEPPYYRRLAGLLGGPAVFGRPRNQIVFAAEMLDAPVLMHDPVAQRLAREQCERELEKFGAGGQFLLRVRSAMTTGSRVASLGEVARQMGISERTLKRRLAECGTSYSQLVAELLYSRALQYLRDESLSMEQVAERLGYSDAANFTRAFRRWSGTTPALFRRTLRTAEPGRPEPPVTSSAKPQSAASTSASKRCSGCEWPVLARRSAQRVEQREQVSTHQRCRQHAICP